MSHQCGQSPSWGAHFGDGQQKSGSARIEHCDGFWKEGCKAESGGLLREETPSRMIWELRPFPGLTHTSDNQQSKQRWAAKRAFNRKKRGQLLRRLRVLTHESSESRHPRSR